MRAATKCPPPRLARQVNAGPAERFPQLVQRGVDQCDLALAPPFKMLSRRAENARAREIDERPGKRCGELLCLSLHEKRCLKRITVAYDNVSRKVIASGDDIAFKENERDGVSISQRCAIKAKALRLIFDLHPGPAGLIP